MYTVAILVLNILYPVQPVLELGRNIRPIPMFHWPDVLVTGDTISCAATRILKTEMADWKETYLVFTISISGELAHNSEKRFYVKTIKRQVKLVQSQSCGFITPPRATYKQTGDTQSGICMYLCHKHLCQVECFVFSPLALASSVGVGITFTFWAVAQKWHMDVSGP